MSVSQSATLYIVKGKIPIPGLRNIHFKSPTHEKIQHAEVLDQK